MSWDPAQVKAQLRFAAQRLGQLQHKLDSQGLITKRDIATLLQQGNIVLARAKAQNVIKEEIRGDVLQVLEMYIGVILEHFGELERSENPSPILLEAASSITFATPQVDVKELVTARDFLIQRLGPDFARAAAGNKDNYVSASVVRALSAPPPSAARLDDYMSGIATAHGVQWTPDLRPHEKLTALSEILDPEAAPVIDLHRLRQLCAYGLPDHPSWLRPRIWRILLGILPIIKSAWADDARKQRDSYYDLVRRLLEPFANLPLPYTPLSPPDSTLVDVSKQLSRVPPNLYSQLEEEPESLALCPLNEDAPNNIRIICANNLDSRLKIINRKDSEESDANTTPEIRLESDENTTPEIAVISPESFTSRRPSAPTTLHPSRLYGAGAAHKKHTSALLRLLYIHSCLNPANHSPHMASLLIPLYSVLNTEIEVDDLAHAEADTFWLFEAIVGEFSELEDEEGGNLWMKKFGERLAWADPELSADLQAKGLDPGLPHYSYRWLAPLLTHTLPLPSVWMTWDVLFSRPMRERDSNAKLDSLLDICTSMLIRARTPLFRLGKPGQRSPGLWAEENNLLPPPSPLRAWEFSDAFLEGMSLLQLYPVETAGGMDRILQTAGDLTSRREAQLKAPPIDNTSLGARLRDTMWRGFTNQVTSAPPSPSLSATDTDENETGNESEISYSESRSSDTPQQPRPSSGFTSILASTVWKGFTNSSPAGSPTVPESGTPRFSIPPSPELRAQSVSSIPPSPLSLTRSFTPEPPPGNVNIWSYAEKLRDSDTAAKLAKASTNWRVKALEAWSNRPSVATNIKSAPTSPPLLSNASLAETRSSQSRRESAASEGTPSRHSPANSMLDSDSPYSPPERPAFFRNPRDSLQVDPRVDYLRSSPSSPDLSPLSESGSAVSSSSRSKHGGPKPLLLNSGSLMSQSTPAVDKKAWPEATRRTPINRDSVSSVSSTSPSDYRTKSHRAQSRDFDSDSTRSRVIPIKRTTFSPAALSSRLVHSRPPSASSTASSDRAFSPKSEVIYQDLTVIKEPNGKKDGGRFPSPDSPITLPSSPPPKTPVTSISLVDQAVRVTTVERQRGSVVLTESSDTAEDSSVAVAQPFIRKKTPSPTRISKDRAEASDSSAGVPIRSKIRRQPLRLRIRDNSTSNSTKEQPSCSPNSLALPEWPHEVETISTPKATNFDVAFPSSRRTPRKMSSDDNGEIRTRKLSSESREARTRKTSEGRVRKISTESRRNRDSSAVEGDDEGYDELLSAYESEVEHS